MLHTHLFVNVFYTPVGTEQRRLIEFTDLMGITGLWGYIEEHAPGASTVIEESSDDLRGKRIAVDATLLVTAVLKVTMRPDCDSEWMFDFVREVLRRVEFMHFMGASVVMVFDGPSHPLKADTRKERAKQQERANARLQELVEQSAPYEDVVKASRVAARVTPEMLSVLRVALEACGIDVAIARHDAESCCAAMCAAGEAWAVASEDSDVMVFGAPRIVRHLTRNDTGGAATSQVKLVSLERVLFELNITQEHLVCVAAMCGSDYNPGGLSRIGLVRALKLIRECKNLNNVLTKVKCTEDVGSKCHQGSQVFTNVLNNGDAPAEMCPGVPKKNLEDVFDIVDDAIHRYLCSSRCSRPKRNRLRDEFSTEFHFGSAHSTSTEIQDITFLGVGSVIVV